MVGYDKTQTQLGSFEYALAGAISGAGTRFLTQPFDVLKIRFQLQVEPISKHSSTSKYYAMMQATKSIIKEEGILGLWKGHLNGQYLSVTYGIVQFQAFEMLTKLAEKHFKTEARSTTVHALCGSISGVLGTIASFPFDVMRTRFIAQGNEKMYFTIYQGVRTAIKNEGPVALFKGLTPSLVLVAPQAGATFAFHNLFTTLFSTTVFTKGEKYELIGSFTIGSLAGICAKSLVYPFDLSRKRLQLQGFQEGRKGFGENFTCRGMINCLYLTGSREGVAGLYKGLVPSILKAGVTTALYFLLYEESCKLLISMK